MTTTTTSHNKDKDNDNDSANLFDLHKIFEPNESTPTLTGDALVSIKLSSQRGVRTCCCDQSWRAFHLFLRIKCFRFENFLC